jgi:drug/metabolite transporter (DMT)-like permease
MGILLCFFAAFCGASKDLISKKISFESSSLFSTFTSFSFALPFYLVITAVFYIIGVEDFYFQNTFLFYAVVRGSIDIIAEWTKMHALGCADISLISPIIGASPAFILVFGYFINGDLISKRELIGVVFVLLGTLCLLIPSKKVNFTNQKKGIVFAFCSSISFALLSCLDKEAVQLATPLFTAASMTLVSSLLLAVPLFFFEKKQCLNFKTGIALSFRGLFEVLFMLSKLWALIYFPAVTVAALMKISLVFKVASGSLIFNEKDLLKKIISSLLITVGVLVIIFAKA